MVKMYLIEGPDGAGKTTLAEGIKREHEDRGESVHIWHNGVREESSRAEYLEPLLDIIDNEDDYEYNVVIIDRLHISEVIYAQVLRGGETDMDDELGNEIEDALDALNTTRIWCDTPLINCINRCAERGEDLVDNEMLAQVHSLYDWTLSGNHKWNRLSLIEQNRTDPRQ